jgi:GNAT superfamily N-acetyltransferase
MKNRSVHPIPPALQLRVAAVSDAESLSALSRALLEYERTLNECAGTLKPWAASPEEIRKQIRHPDTRFFVAESSGEIIGYLKAVIYGRAASVRQAGLIAWLKSLIERVARRVYNLLLQRPRPGTRVTAGYIAGAYVIPSRRGCGVGRQLMEAAEKWFDSEGLLISELHVLWNNESARRFWNEAGYEPVIMGLRKKLSRDEP